MVSQRIVSIGTVTSYLKKVYYRLVTRAIFFGCKIGETNIKKMQKFSDTSTEFIICLAIRPTISWLWNLWQPRHSNITSLRRTDQPHQPDICDHSDIEKIICIHDPKSQFHLLTYYCQVDLEVAGGWVSEIHTTPVNPLVIWFDILNE